MAKPTQSVQGGFLIVFFGLLSFLISLLSGYAAWLVFDKEVIQHIKTPYHYGQLGFLSIACLLIGGGLVWFGFKLARRVKHYDTRDPEEPMLKW